MSTIPTTATVLLLLASQLEEAIPGNSFSTAESPLQRYLASAALFDDATSDDIERWYTHGSDDIAIRAAWENATRSIPTYENQALRKPEERHPGTQEEVSWFLGFVAGRLRIKVPEQVRELTMRLTIARDEQPDGTVSSLAQFPVDDDELEGATIAEAELKEESGVLKLVVQGAAYAIEDAGPLPAVTSAAEIAGDVYIVVSDGFCLTNGARLIKVNAKSRSVEWRSTVWVSADGGASGLPPKHITAITFREDAVFVFGVCRNVLFIEGFSRDDGHSVVRFSSAL